MVYEFAASGKILLEVTDQTGDDAEFGMSGIIQVPLSMVDYSTVWQNTGRSWIDGRQVKEVVVSGFAPAPGQGITIGMPYAYMQIVDAKFWITDGESMGFAMPIPHSWPSGLSAPTSQITGTWSLIYVGGIGLLVYASPNTYDHSSNIIHGVVRFVNI
jgi:hypothetical protein